MRVGATGVSGLQDEFAEGFGGGLGIGRGEKILQLDGGARLEFDAEVTVFTQNLFHSLDLTGNGVHHAVAGARLGFEQDGLFAGFQVGQRGACFNGLMGEGF